MGDRSKTTLNLPKQLWKDFQKRCIDLDLSNTSAAESAMREWLEKNQAPAERPAVRRVGGKSGA